MYVGMIREIARRHGLGEFKIGWFYSELDKEVVRARIRGGSPATKCRSDPFRTSTSFRYSSMRRGRCCGCSAEG
jgi:hypothetical protein